MSLLGTKATLGGIILVAGQLLFSANVQAATENHIYGGDFCQLDHSGSPSALSHAYGNAAADVGTELAIITCPVPRLTKPVTATSSMTVKVAVHDSGSGLALPGVACTLESLPHYNNNFAVTNSFSANTFPTGISAEKDATLTLTVKPVDALGSYSFLCVLPANNGTSQMNSSIYSYEVIQTY